MSFTVQYVAYLREAAGTSEEIREAGAATAAELYDEVAAVHGFRWSRSALSVAVNGKVQPWTVRLQPGDQVLFLPPASGG